MDESRYMTAQDAAAELGISVATVYAYVSRGLLRSEAVGGSKRQRRYHREDVQRLKMRQEYRHQPEKITDTALHFGAPLLESSLTLIDDGELYYRGFSTISLAQTHQLETAAALLWTGDMDTAIDFSGQALAAKCQTVLTQLGSVTYVEQCQALLPLAAQDDLRAYDLRPANVIRSGTAILRLLAGVGAAQTEINAPVAGLLQHAWVPDDGQARALLNMALVLCADHELNVSSFTARCIASAGSTPYAAVLSALAAVQGHKHGGSAERVRAMLSEIRAERDMMTALSNRIRRGDSLPGFGHLLYPDGDPRGRLLLDSLATAYPDSESVVFGAELCRHVFDLTGIPPNIDFGLVMLAETLGLPKDAPIKLFAIGRTVGWIGHVLEQYAIDQLIRPRARYVGIQPGD